MSGVTLSSLIPNIGDEPSYSDLKFSVRKIGSRLLNLKKASRLPTSTRKYMHGDPVRYIDWRAYARTDQLLLRENRDEASSKIKICLDLTQTMFWPRIQSDEPIAEKAEIAIRVALHLAYHHLKRGDVVNLLVCRTGALQATEKVSILSASDVLLIFNHLRSSNFEFRLKGVLQSLREHPNKSYDNTYIIGDMLERSDLSMFVGNAKEHTLLQVMSSMEMDLDWVDDGICYFDESSAKLEFQGSYLRNKSDYNLVIHEWLENIRLKFTGPNRRYFLLTDKTPIDIYLANIFS